MNEVNYPATSPIVPAQSPQAPQTPESPKSPKKKGIFAYVGLALGALVIDYFLTILLAAILKNFGEVSGNIGILFYYLIPPLTTFILSSIFFKKETLGDRILKSILGTIFLGLLIFLIGLGFCFLLLAGSGVGV